MRLLLLLLLGLSSFYGPRARAASAPHPTILDYFLLLPPANFEGSPAGWLSVLRQPGFGVVDVPNGYLSCGGDGAQTAFEVALFRHRDNRPLIALCDGVLEGDDYINLHFFELGPNGKFREISRKIFPVPDSVKWRFELPRHGRTVLVRDLHGGKIRRKLTWNGESFQEDQ